MQPLFIMFILRVIFAADNITKIFVGFFKTFHLHTHLRIGIIIYVNTNYNKF